MTTLHETSPGIPLLKVSLYWSSVYGQVPCLTELAYSVWIIGQRPSSDPTKESTIAIILAPT